MHTLLSIRGRDSINIELRFLLAQLHMDALMSKSTRGGIKLALRNLPDGMKGLDVIYDQAMKRIDGQEEGFRELAKLVLSWWSRPRDRSLLQSFNTRLRSELA